MSSGYNCRLSSMDVLVVHKSNSLVVCSLSRWAGCKDRGRGGASQGASQEKMTTHLKSIVSLAGGAPVATLRVRAPVAALAAQPGGGALLAAACGDGCLRIWDSDSLQLVAGFRVRTPGQGWPSLTSAHARTYAIVLFQIRGGPFP